MPSYTWSDIIATVRPFIKSIPTSAIDSVIADKVNSKIWLHYPWAWSVATLTSASAVLNLVDGQQDYGIGTTTGGGYYKLLRARIVRTDVSPVQAKEFTTIANYLAPNANQSTDPLAIDAIAFEQLTSGLRLAQCPSVTGSATYIVGGEYQFSPIKITTSATTIVFPDRYVAVAIEGVKAEYYQLGDDPRALSQMAIFEQKLREMADAEDYSGEDTRFPDVGLGIEGSNNSGGTWW